MILLMLKTVVAASAYIKCFRVSCFSSVAMGSEACLTWVFVLQLGEAESSDNTYQISVMPFFHHNGQLPFLSPFQNLPLL